MSETGSLASALITTTQKAMAYHAQNLGKQGAGGKSSQIFFQPHAGGVATAETMSDNTKEGQTVDSSRNSFSITGQGGMVVKKTNGDMAVMRSGVSQGLNKDENYVVGAEGYQVMAWAARATDGALLQKDGVTPITNIDDSTNLVNVSLSEHRYRAEPSTQVKINNLLNVNQEIGGAGDSQQITKFYDALGKEHELTLTWRRTYGANDARNITVGGTPYNNCDVWRVEITYDGGIQTQQGGAGGAAFDFNNTPDLYFLNGKLVGISDNDTPASLLNPLTFPEIYIPLPNDAVSPMTLDMGLSLVNNEGFSDLTEAEVDGSSTFNNFSAQTDGSPLIESSGWFVNKKGELYVTYPNGEAILTYVLPVGIYDNLNSVEVEGGLWLSTGNSGPMRISKPGQGSAGEFEFGTIEETTTNSTKEMVDVTQLSMLSAAAAALLKQANDSEQTILRSFS